MKMIREVDVTEEFAVLELVTWKEFTTVSSISFALGLWQPWIKNGDRSDGGCFETHGRLDVHYPCDDQFPLRILVHLHKTRKLTREMMNDVVVSVCTALQIPQNEAYQATFVIGGEVMLFETDLGGLVTYGAPEPEELEDDSQRAPND